MPNAIKYNTSAESLALKKGNFWIGTGDVGKGLTSSTGYRNGINPPAGGYTIYLNKAANGPAIYTAANDSQLITLTNIIAGVNYNNVNDCFNWFAGQSDKMVVNRDYEPIITDGLVLDIDAGYIPSYPRNGTTWTDLSANVYNSTLTNSPSYDTNNGGSILFNGGNYSIGGTTLNLNNSMTLSAFIYPTSYPTGAGGGGFIFSNIGYYLELANTGYLRSYFYGLSSPGYHNGANLVSLNTWSYVTLVRNQANNTIVQYINTTIDTTINNVTGSINNGIQNYQVGAYQGGSYGYVGRIASVQVYNFALSTAQITQNFNALKGRYGL